MKTNRKFTYTDAGYLSDSDYESAKGDNTKLMEVLKHEDEEFQADVISRRNQGLSLTDSIVAARRQRDSDDLALEAEARGRIRSKRAEALAKKADKDVEHEVRRLEKAAK